MSLDSINIIAAPHPFRTATTDFQLPEGCTISDMLAIMQTDPMLRKYAHVFVDDDYIPTENWDTYRPVAGQTVSVRMVPGGGGGGKNPLRTILTVLVVVAAVAFAPALGGALNAAAISSFGPAAANLALYTAVAQGLILVGGMLLVNLIAPIKPPSSESQPKESPSYFLDQARNQIRPYQAVPVIFGRHRVVPPLGAVPVTEIVGDINHIRMIVVWGYGPCRISDLRIGNTPLTEANFKNFRIETREGRPGTHR